MAPRGKRTAGSGSVEAAEPQAFHELGVRGRKTGAFLRDTGERDEHGMQPLDAIFSSPHIRGDDDGDGDGDGDGSEDMDISSSEHLSQTGSDELPIVSSSLADPNNGRSLLGGGPGPQTVLKSQRTIQNTAGPSSPGQDSNDDTLVSRKLEFGGRGSGDGGTKSRANGKAKASGLNGHGAFSRGDSEDMEAVMAETRQDDLMLDPDEVASPAIDVREHREEREKLEAQAPTQAKKSRGRPPRTAPKPTSAPAPAPKAVPKPTSRPVTKAPAKTEFKPAPKAAPRPVGRPAKVPSPEPSPELEEPKVPEGDEEKDAGVEQEAEEEAQEELEVEQAPAKRKRGRPAKDSPKVAQPQRDHQRPDAASKKRRSIEKEPAAAPTQPESDDDAPRKKQRTSRPPAPRSEPPKPRGPGRPKAAAPVPKSAPAPPAAKPGARGRPGRKPKPAAEPEIRADKGSEAEASFAGLSRAPPLPKSRGLVSVRKDNTMTQTRSGRHSYKPVAYWRGEQVIQEVEEQDDMFNREAGFVMPSIKEVVRVPLEGPRPKSAASRGRSSRSKPKKVEPEEEDLEEWEVSPGVVEGEIVLWEPEHEEHPPADDEAVQVTDERIAISASAIQTSDIRDATFRFAKTLTMPFMGAGVVDLPPGGEKRPKNSRKMHMVFFVHTGKVMVTINEAQFRISAGGMWFVPRGNYYSITNDYDSPSRVFFCQSCELSASSADVTQQSVA